MSIKKIKIPVLITAPLHNAMKSYDDMAKAVKSTLEEYNNYPDEKKTVVQYVKKSKKKTIKNIAYDIIDFNKVKSILIRVEEFKTGINDLYLQTNNTIEEKEIEPEDKLGSNNNYALLYPLISFDDTGKPINKWCAFVYDDPSKDDADVKNTIKTVLTRILKYKVKAVIRDNADNRMSLAETISKIKISYVTVANIENEDERLKEYQISLKERSSKEVIYEGVPANIAKDLANDNSLDGYQKKVLDMKVSDSLSYKYVYEEDNESQTSMLTALEENNCYEIEVNDDDYNDIHNPKKVVTYLRDVISKFIINE